MFLLFTALDLLHALEKRQKTDENWITTTNTLRYIDLNHIHYHFGLEPFQCFILFQTVILVSPDKVRPPQLIEKYESVQQVFSKFNEWTTITDGTQVLEGYVCTIYAQKIFQSVCKLHLEMILKVYKPHNNSFTIDKTNIKIQNLTILTFVKL